MPVVPKKVKQTKKEQPQLIQQVIMPIKAMMNKVEDVESIPQINESFDYSMTDPLVDEILPEEMSQTGVTSQKNSMF